MANKLKAYVATIIGEPKPPPQTKLGYRLRQLADKLEGEAQVPGATENEFAVIDRINRIRIAARNLDQTAIALGLKGARVKTCGAYIAAARIFYDVTGAAYNG